MKAFLELELGDRSTAEKAAADFELTRGLYETVGAQYGLSGPLEELDQESKALLRDAFDADPKWKRKGNFLAERPPSLRAGRLELELYDKVVPKTVENFRCLITGERGKGKASGKALHYKGCKFHRVVLGFVAQAGDIVRGDGSGGDSIYGGKFNDEKAGLKLRHDALGTLSMANSGKNSNTSQFYITLAKELPQLDGKHVVFGRVVGGLELLQRINEVVASEDGNPQCELSIADCGTS